jgi:Fur family ferric uptake transcriptional regulator
MKDATKEILHELSGRGFRITEARKEIIEALARQSQPVSIQTLCATLANTDEASVYRTIKVLARENFLEEIALQGEVPRYALSHGHHHHAVCTECGWMEHIECDPHSLSARIPSSFKSLLSHEVILYGLCKKCA